MKVRMQLGEFTYHQRGLSRFNPVQFAKGKFSMQPIQFAAVHKPFDSKVTSATPLSFGQSTAGAEHREQSPSKSAPRRKSSFFLFRWLRRLGALFGRENTDSAKASSDANKRWLGRTVAEAGIWGLVSSLVHQFFDMLGFGHKSGAQSDPESDTSSENQTNDTSNTNDSSQTVANGGDAGSAEPPVSDNSDDGGWFSGLFSSLFSGDGGDAGDGGD